MSKHAVVRRFLVFVLSAALVAACNDPGRAGPDQLVGAKTTGDTTPPDIQLGAHVSAWDGRTIGDGPATPSAVTPAGPVALGTADQVLLGATATDDDGGVRSVRMF